METSHDPSLKPPLPADDPQLDLYTIPTHSSWFSWADIHEIEKLHLREFFDGTSITRTPKIYKEYRDFIISKYREDTSRRLTFTEVRKSLVGDVSLLHKVFSFLDWCGLINFGAPAGEEGVGEEESAGKWKVRVEEGAPHGVRVVAEPNSLKPATLPSPLLPSGICNGGDLAGNGYIFPPLASYRDVYGEQKEVTCIKCKHRCESGHYQCIKDGSFTICIKCFNNGNYGEKKSKDDLKIIGCIAGSDNCSTAWTEAETLLLLESVLKHGDDWGLVAENVKTKSKEDCISKLIQLPFGDLMLGPTHGKGRLWDSDGNMSRELGKLATSATDPLENAKTEDEGPNAESESNQNGDAEIEDPPLKRKRITSSSNTGSSLMKQIAVLSSVVDPHITASAADAAIAALCDEIQCPREIFDGAEDQELGSSPQKNKAPQVDGLEIDERPNVSESREILSEKNDIPLTLRMRTATATALGAAAARAKLLADQEDKEIECLVADIIETQLKKLQRKIKHFDDLELIMEKEHEELEDLKESIIVERMDVLQRVFSAGISRWTDQTPAKSQMGVL